MSRPRPVLPGKIYLITRRCIFRRFFLIPTEQVVEIILYCLLYAAKLHHIKLHAICVLSNHYHLVLTDLFGNLPAFMQWANREIARCIKHHYQHRGCIWDPVRYSRVELEEGRDMLEKMAYVLANPVAAALVARGEEWFGIRTSTLQKGAQKLVARRPAFFSEKSGLPEVIEYEIELPQKVVELQGGERGTLLRDAVLQREGELRAELKRQGRGFLGRRGVFGAKITDVPRSEERESEINPRVAARDRKLRVRMLEKLKAFQSAYREAYAKYRAGAREVLFPAGTYWLRLHMGVRCHDPPFT